jgi:GNAT superfamily N-acetyltransferase
MSFELRRLGRLPADFPALADMAKQEGFDFVSRLGARWDGARYADDALATVWGAFAGDDLIAIGAQTCDEYDPSPRHRRIRHFYVRAEHRRGGVGRALAAKLIEDAHALAPFLHLRATRAHSAAFWESVGFSRAEGREDRTHVLVRD